MRIFFSDHRCGSSRFCGLFPKGFTLIELLIVVAIIAILAAIAVPNFLEAQVRAKVSRVLSDQRTIATALETYRIDNNQYPPRRVFPTGSGLFNWGDIETREEDMSRMTTPISYITQIPRDPFENRVALPNALYDYWTPEIVRNVRRARFSNPNIANPYGWALISVGPDGIFGRGAINAGQMPAEDGIISFQFDYDPTNGTVSLGNIYRFQSQRGGTHVFNN